MPMGGWQSDGDDQVFFFGAMTHDPAIGFPPLAEPLATSRD